MRKGMKKPDITRTEDGEISVLRWSHRRRMAWVSLWAIIGLTLFLWAVVPFWFHVWGIDLKWIDPITDTFAWVVSVLAIGVVTYLGFEGEIPMIGRRGKSYLSRGRKDRPDTSEPDNEKESDNTEEYYEVK